jgi:hypothetical protein
MGKTTADACKFKFHNMSNMESTTTVQIHSPDHCGTSCLLALGLLRDVAGQKMFESAKRQQMHANSNSRTCGNVESTTTVQIYSLDCGTSCLLAVRVTERCCRTKDV